MRRPGRYGGSRRHAATATVSRVAGTEERGPRRSVLSLAGITLLGALAGAAGSFLQAARWGPLPWGVTVALGLSLVAFVLGGRAVGRVTGALSALAGWAGAVLVMLRPRDEGDLVLANTATAYTWLLGGLLLAAASLTVPYRRLPYSRLPYRRLADLGRRGRGAATPGR